MTQERRALYVTKDEAAFWGADLYDCQDSERLTHECPDEAVQEYLDEWTDEQRAAGGSVTVTAYNQMPLNTADLDPENVVTAILERLDDEYGDSDEDYTQPTSRMIHAAEALVAAIRKDYRVWNCERIAEAVVDVHAWTKAYEGEQ